MMATDMFTTARGTATTEELHTAQFAREGHTFGDGHGTPVRHHTGWIALLAVATTLLLITVLSPGFRFDLGAVISVLQRLDPAAIRDVLLAFGIWTPIIYVLLVIAQVIIAPIPSPPITIAGVLLFGVWHGLALGFLGTVIGSVLVFALARRWGMPLAHHFAHEATVRKHMRKIDAHGWLVFFVFLLPFLPDDVIAAAAGLSTMSFRRFFGLVVVGRFPGTALTVLITAGLLERSVTTWVSLGSAGAVFVAIGWLYHKRIINFFTRLSASEE